MTPDIIFTNLGIEIQHLIQQITIGSFSIKFYGIAIAVGMLLGMTVAFHFAEKDGADVDSYYTFAIVTIILSIIGARAYYVVFTWDFYREHPEQILNIRGGGLAIYGGVLTAMITAIVFTRIKKMPFLELADHACFGLILGQAIGRWGNFFNCEAFGGYTDGLFAMQIRRGLVNSANISPALAASMKEHPILIDGVEYIQVHPTFLYESMWNLAVFAAMLIYRKFRKKDGENFCIYLVGYGIGRFLIESLRTDQLKLWGTNIAVSQIVSILLVIAGITLFVYCRFFSKSAVLSYNVRVANGTFRTKKDEGKETKKEKSEKSDCVKNEDDTKEDDSEKENSQEEKSGAEKKQKDDDSKKEKPEPGEKKKEKESKKPWR